MHLGNALAQPRFVQCGAGVVLGHHPFRTRLLRSMTSVASPMVGCFRLSLEVCPACLGGTRKIPSEQYSSGSSGSAWGSASHCCRFASNASETYLRETSLSTTCSDSATSMLLRSASVIRQSADLKPS